MKHGYTLKRTLSALLQNDILTYRRRKTGQQLTIRWERCMEDIVNKYTENETEYLLPFIKERGNERSQGKQCPPCLSSAMAWDMTLRRPRRYILPHWMRRWWTRQTEKL